MTYNANTQKANNIINHDEIIATLAWVDANKNNQALISEIMQKAAQQKGLNHREAALILESGNTADIFRLARDIKAKFYGNRIVLFAPLYLSNYCVNGCVYCPYNCHNKNIARKKLSQDDIRREVMALQDMGHKRIVIEAGEHPEHNPIGYILESIETIYGTRHKNGTIRRLNVNLAATTVEEYKMLKQAGIGTYILFQETYHEETYRRLHPSGLKADYAWHTQAMDRAMEGGIDDVGIGVLFGLADYKYEFVALLMHSQHLEKTYGTLPHTISVPRIRGAEDINPNSFSNRIDDDTFAKIVACIRISVPYTGIVVSTREDRQSREKVLDVGVSQISGGSRTSVGGYEAEEKINTQQFEISDNRSLDEVVRWLMEIGYVPSFCTACYKEGRTGYRFMELCKSGQIHNFCHSNALMTLQEYLMDYSDKDTAIIGERLINKELATIPNEKTRVFVAQKLEQIRKGSRDFRV
ncbi:MAG: [FeFe] hydrogenase H-cluster radical SAM maturase HydG [Defluviitaleaceae bacterium]|nr:[FeFe] hydrogenase H-cluster radical SAM maturase HydG [Defluviitaleaceae bacterium]